MANRKLHVKEEANPAQCTVNSPEMTRAIARLLGVDVGTREEVVARLACAGARLWRISGRSTRG